MASLKIGSSSFKELEGKLVRAEQQVSNLKTRLGRYPGYRKYLIKKWFELRKPYPLYLQKGEGGEVFQVKYDSKREEIQYVSFFSEEIIHSIQLNSYKLNSKFR